VSSSELLSFDNPWFTRSVAITAAIFVVAALGGFVLLPYAQGELAWNDLWNAICSAAGAPTSPTGGKVVKPDYKVSPAVLTHAPAAPGPESVGRGATLAQQCAICHGPTGVSRADSPNLAGQYASVIYKQLVDFRSGARTNAVMTPFATNLSDQDIHDLAAYYAYLPRLPAYHPAPEGTPPRIVMHGAPLRGIAPCGSCHGALDNKPGSPWLEGLSAAYMKAQLEAFAAGTRRNDISMQMRNVAKKLTAEEIRQASDYYAAQPAEPVRPFR
jgi:cytochrome c553